MRPATCSSGSSRRGDARTAASRRSGRGPSAAIPGRCREAFSRRPRRAHCRDMTSLVSTSSRAATSFSGTTIMRSNPTVGMRPSSAAIALRVSGDKSRLDADPHAPAFARDGPLAHAQHHVPRLRPDLARPQQLAVGAQPDRLLLQQPQTAGAARRSRTGPAPPAASNTSRRRNGTARCPSAPAAPRPRPRHAPPRRAVALLIEQLVPEMALPRFDDAAEQQFAGSVHFLVQPAEADLGGVRHRRVGYGSCHSTAIAASQAAATRWPPTAR